MSCPNVDRLSEYLENAAEVAPELGAHIEGCESCQEELFLIGEIRGSLTPAMEVPESLIQRTLVALAEETASPAESTPSLFHLAGAGVLGFLTAFLAIFGSGSSGSSSLGLSLVTSLLVGVGAVVVLGRGSGVREPAEMV
jgi:hypothetical protein